MYHLIDKDKHIDVVLVKWGQFYLLYVVYSAHCIENFRTELQMITYFIIELSSLHFIMIRNIYKIGEKIIFK